MTEGLTAEELREIGGASRDLAPMSTVETPLHVAPPPGAGRLLETTSESFRWEPFSPSDWHLLTDEERGSLVVEKALEWLGENADLITAPMSFVEMPDEQVNNVFGIRAQNLHQAMCATYTMLEHHDVEAESSLLLLSGIVLLATGSHLASLGIHATAVVVKAYGRRYCG